MRRLRRWCGDRGATAVEYALMMGLIAGVIILAVSYFGTQVKSLFSITF